ncbi:transcriptional regulator, AraC family [Mycolicibacterium rhodesiae JS60]|nr:transcriptional regulator, AraC family [Mycolicibacterium rhodesiae JS60]
MRDTEAPIRATSLRGFSTLVSSLGGSAAELLAAHGLDEKGIAGRETFISVGVHERLLEDAAARLSMPDFGLRMAAQQDLDYLGPVAVVIENSRTIGEAVECAHRYLSAHSPAMSLKQVADPLHDPDMVGLRYRIATPSASPQPTDYGLGVVHRIMVLLNGGAPYGLRSVHFPHARLAPETVYADFFGAPARFDANNAVLRVPRQLLSAPVRGGNELLREIAIEYLEAHFGHTQSPLSDLVAEIVFDHLGFDNADLATVAGLLQLHPRTLQRLLSDEGSTFNEIVDDVRKAHALNYITRTRLSFAQIATRVGMREQSSLARAVRRWFNTSPSRLRTTGADSGEGGDSARD